MEKRRERIAIVILHYLLWVGLTLWKADDCSYLRKLTLEENCKYSSDISDISVKKGNCLCLT